MDATRMLPALGVLLVASLLLVPPVTACQGMECVPELPTAEPEKPGDGGRDDFRLLVTAGPVIIQVCAGTYPGSVDRPQAVIRGGVVAQIPRSANDHDAYGYGSAC